MSRTSAATRLTTKGQVVIPKPVRTRLGWKPGAILQVIVSSDDLAVTLRRPHTGRASETSWFAEISGIVRRGDPVADLEAEHAAEVERDADRRP